MTSPTPRFWEIFLGVFLALPRQGPVAGRGHGPAGASAEEPEMHHRHSDCYGYAFFVARRPS